MSIETVGARRRKGSECRRDSSRVRRRGIGAGSAQLLIHRFPTPSATSGSADALNTSLTAAVGTWKKRMVTEIQSHIDVVGTYCNYADMDI